MTDPVFPEYQTVTRKVTDYLKHQLMLSSKFKEGDFLREGELAKSLNVSRAPVREALKQLESLGLVKTIPRKGVQIKEFTPDEVEELYELRMTLENSVFQQIIEKKLFTPEVRTRIEPMLDELLAICESDRDRESKILDFSEKDLAFHQSLAELSGKFLTAGILASVYCQMQFVIIRQLEKLDELTETVRLHYNILDCLEKGDLEKIRSERHYSYFVRRFKSRQE